MAPPILKDVLAELRGRIADPARQQILVQLTTDLAQLSSRALAGENVEAELRHVRAQGAMLAAEEAALVRNTLLDWIGVVTGAVVRGALTAALAG